MTIRLRSCHGTRLTDDECTVGADAARAVFTARGVDPEAARDADLAAADDRDHDPSLVEVWRDAENAAVLAATAGWARCPEDLILEVS